MSSDLHTCVMACVCMHIHTYNKYMAQAHNKYMYFLNASQINAKPENFEISKQAECQHQIYDTTKEK